MKIMEGEEIGFREVVEVLLEWAGWGGIVAAVITFLLVATLGSVSLDSEAAAIILMSLLFGVTAWGTSKLIREGEGEDWKRYFGIWIAIVSLGTVLLVLAILFVPT
ncbi:MAG: hypothetical protein KIH01_01835 [Candidatus Freyarchaeota archaeon]|nr:hypothetical protein [Candidatus Jordarchaeia archaeon]